MSDIGRYSITSEDFADFLIDYDGNMDTFNEFPDGFINFINSEYAVLHTPVSYMNVDTISTFGYSAIPCLFGLQTDIATDYANVVTPTPVSSHQLTGRDILLGIVDTGIDYLNPAFMRPDGTSRIAAIWDQTIESEQYPEGMNYGTEYSNQDINEALTLPNPLSKVPSMDDIGHGTKLAGIAGGSGVRDVEFSGIAPNVEFVIVKLKQAKQYLRDFFYIPEGAPCYEENDIMMGVRYLFEYSEKVHRPLSICLGIGTSQGEHTGSGFLSSFLSSYASYFGSCICVPAGNESSRGHHYYKTLTPNVNFDTIDLNIDRNNKGFTMELYSLPPSELLVEVYAPGGELVTRVPSLEGRKTVQASYRDTSIIIDYDANKDTLSQRQITIFRIKNPVPGIWKLIVYGTARFNSSFHMWLPIAPFISPDTFFVNSNNNTTITAPGNTLRLMTVTAYNPFSTNLYYYAGKGNTATGEPKPDFAAPGVNMLVPDLENTFIQSSGTSLASAYTAGIAALLLEWGVIHEQTLLITTVTVKWLFTMTARRIPRMEYPNPDWGYGILDFDKALELLRTETELP